MHLRSAVFLLLITALPSHAIHNKNAGPEKVEIKFKLPPPAPLKPDEALKAFTIEKGYRIELVAAEPLIEAPIAMSWDDLGRLYVLEMRGYMHDVTGSKDLEPLGRIKLLTDTDGDGRMDKASTFVDSLILPRAVMAVNGGALVAAPPQLFFCKDTNNDGVADTREVVAEDFGNRTGQPEHMANSPVWAMDNSVWFAGWGTRLRLRGGTWVRDTGLGRGQYGLCQDDAGRLFFNYNSDLLRCDLLPAEAYARNPLLRGEAGINVKVLKDQTVWPAHPTPGINRGYEPKGLRADGSLTAATATCGALIYRGDALPACHGNAFIPEPSGNLVKRALLTEKDGVITATNATPGREFLTSTDERFRPVVASDGPDGALYLVDMYRGIIQHSGFLTHYLIANIEARKLTLPLDCGRIWRIVPDKAARPSPVRIPPSAKDRAALLGHANGWVRDTAQRLLVESADATAAPEVKAAFAKPNTIERLHALWSLEGLGSLTPEIMRAAFKDPDARVRAAAVRMAGRESAPELLNMTTEPETLVRAHLAIKLSSFALPDTDAALAKLLAVGNPPLVSEGALTGLRGREAGFATLLAAQPGAEKCGDFFKALATLVSTANKGTPIVDLLTLAAAHPPLQSSILTGLTFSADAKKPRLAWLDKEPAAFAKLRSAKQFAALDARLAWPGKPGAPEPPKIDPLTPAQSALAERGRTVYQTLCAACHQPHGFGLDGLAPPLVDSEWLVGKPDIPARIIMHGMAGAVKVGPRTWNLAMPPLPQLTDEDIAGVLTYLRREWEHTAGPVEPAEVAALRAKFKDRTLPWSAAELKGGKK
jgi:mono/diheme cytochrome c family protein/glucose/arabinose dehydrogenase